MVECLIAHRVRAKVTTALAPRPMCAPLGTLSVACHRRQLDYVINCACDPLSLQLDYSNKAACGCRPANAPLTANSTHSLIHTHTGRVVRVFIHQTLSLELIATTGVCFLNAALRARTYTNTHTQVHVNVHTRMCSTYSVVFRILIVN